MIVVPDGGTVTAEVEFWKVIVVILAEADVVEMIGVRVVLKVLILVVVPPRMIVLEVVIVSVNVNKVDTVVTLGGNDTKDVGTVALEVGYGGIPEDVGKD